MDCWPLCREPPLLPFEVLILPSHNVEIFNTYVMTSGVVVVKYGGGGLLVFFEPFTKGSWGLSCMFLITVHPATFVSVDDPTLLHHRILVLWGHQEVFNGSTSFEIYLYTIVAAHFSWHFHSAPYNMEQLCMVWGCCLLVFIALSWWFLIDHLVLILPVVHFVGFPGILGGAKNWVVLPLFNGIMVSLSFIIFESLYLSS